MFNFVLLIGHAMFPGSQAILGMPAITASTEDPEEYVTTHQQFSKSSCRDEYDLGYSVYLFQFGG